MSQSLARGLAILRALGDGPQRLDTLASGLDVHKSTVLRLVQTLEVDGFVTHDADHRYTLGSRLFELANTALSQRDIRSVVRPHLEELNRATLETVHLASLEGGEAVYIDKLDAVKGMRMYSRIGLRAPLHCTAVAKVLVSALPEARWASIAETIDFVPMTANTVTDAAGYLDELTRVRAAGYAEDHEEHEAFINCIAAPIRDGSGAVVAAASLSVPMMSRSHDEVVALLPRLLEATRNASADLGWAGTPTAEPSRTPPQESEHD